MHRPCIRPVANGKFPSASARKIGTDERESPPRIRSAGLLGARPGFVCILWPCTDQIREAMRHVDEEGQTVDHVGKRTQMAQTCVRNIDRRWYHWRHHWHCHHPSIPIKLLNLHFAS